MKSTGKNAERIGAPRPAAGESRRRTFSAPQAKKNFALCSAKRPRPRRAWWHFGAQKESLKARSRRAIIGRSGERKVSGSTCSTGVTILLLTGPQRANGEGVRVLGSVGKPFAGEGGKKSVPPSPMEMSTCSSPTLWCRSRAPAWSARLTDSRRAPPLL